VHHPSPGERSVCEPSVEYNICRQDQSKDKQGSRGLGTDAAHLGVASSNGCHAPEVSSVIYYKEQKNERETATATKSQGGRRRWICCWRTCL
jgi:hypothetical protein